MHYIRTVYIVQENIQWNDFVKHFCFIECHIVLAFHCGLILFWLSSFLFIRMPQQLVIFFGLVNCIFQRIFPFLLRAKSIKHTRTDKHKTESNAQNHPETWFRSVSRTLHAYWKDGWNRGSFWNICSNVVVDCLIVNSAQPVSFVTVCMTQQAEQFCRRVQSTSYQLKHWLLTIIVEYKQSCLASYISAAGVGQALLGCQSTTIRRCETQDLHLGTSVQCVVLILTVNFLRPVCLLFSRGYIHIYRDDLWGK